MKNTNTRTYFNAKMPREGLFLSLDAMDEFVRYTSFTNVHTIFLLTEKEHRYFACLHQGSLIGHSTEGFETLEEYQQAKQNGFSEASDFYEARKEGYSSFKDYQLVKEAGISDPRIFEKIKSQDYITGFEDYKALEDKPPRIPEFLNAYQLYKYASEQSFSNYAHFKGALQKGFTDAPAYIAATEKGFVNAADYEDAKGRGFVFSSDYNKAKEHDIRDIDELKLFLDLEFLNGQDLEHHDKRVLLGVLSQLPQNKKVSINRLNELFQQVLAQYKDKDNGGVRPWFKMSLNTLEELTAFLISHDMVKKFGTYDTEGEYFETRHLNERKVVIDGSNVAHNSQGNQKSQPSVENLIKLVKELKQKGFNEIRVIADASLKHRLIDKEKLTELAELCEYVTAPAESPADVYLISLVKHHRCLLVTNDVFREWKVRDSWVASNIDYYKLSFMIDGDRVIMPDLETAVMAKKVVT